MFITYTLLFTLTLFLFWSYAGSILLLKLFWLLGGSKLLNGTEFGKKNIAVLIPCYNESSLLECKVNNLEELVYPEEKVSFYFLDGCSDDLTLPRLRKLIGNKKNWHIIETGVQGKIHQMNVGLSLLPDDIDIVVNTDMDTLLEPDVLTRLEGCFSADPSVAVAGANISPGECLPIEQSYWDSQNIVRILESTVCTASIVVAPCYAFRKGLIDQFPEDCVADDIFVSFTANTMGYKSRYLARAKGMELRCPTTFETFFNHKFRKGNAYVGELFRFLYRLPTMHGWWKLLYLTKFMQLVMMPYLLPVYALTILSLLFEGRTAMLAAGISLVVLFGSMLLASASVHMFRRHVFGQTAPNPKGLLLPFIFSNIILLAIGLSFPFYRQNSKYARISNTCRYSQDTQDESSATLKQAS